MSNKTITLSTIQIVELITNLHQYFPNETGGILMGSVHPSGWSISHVIGPGPNAIHRSNSFEPDYDYHIQEVAGIYESSNCELVYLGDWHTHPQAAAYLSGKDKNTLKSISQSKEARVEEPLMLILGTNPFQLKGWMFQSMVLWGDRFTPVKIHLGFA